MDYVKTPNDILHGDEHLEDSPNYIQKQWVDYKIIVVWDDGVEEDLTDSSEIYLGKGCLAIDEQLDLMAEERNEGGEWGYHNDGEEHF